MLSSPAVQHPLWLRVLGASAAAAGAFALTLALGLDNRPFLLPMIVVLLCAIHGGFVAGLAAGVVTMLLAHYYLVEPRRSFGAPSLVDAYQLAIFVITAAIISIVAARQRRAQLTLAATLSGIADGVIVTDANGRIAFINGIAAALTGWPPAEAMGSPVQRVFKAVSEGSRIALTNPAERALADGTPVVLEDHTVLISRDGTERPIAENAAPVRDVDGFIIGAVLVFRDVASARAVERTLLDRARERETLLEREQHARAEAERANRLKDEFLATLSHELRTPLNAVLGWAQMMMTRELRPDQREQALASIYRNAQAQARLVEDVLDLSRIVTGRLALTTEPVNLVDVLRSAAESFTPAVLAKRQELVLDAPAEAVVSGDPHRLRQVVWNLLSNATKFTPAGGRVSARITNTEGQFELRVSDTGQGIDPEFLPFVFERFRQGDASTTRRHGGLGLGLALVRYLVEAHGGAVRAESEGAGRGTTISIILPAWMTYNSGATPSKDKPWSANPAS